MGKLRLSTTELAKHLGDASGLEAAEQDIVPLLAAGRQAEASLALLQSLGRGNETCGIGLGTAVSQSENAVIREDVPDTSC